MSAAVTMQDQPFAISVVPDREDVVVIPAGDLDLSTADRLADEVRDLRDAGFGLIVLDLSDVQFLDSSGLRLLLGLRRDAERDGHHLRLVPGRPCVQRLFELTATHDLFDWRDR